MAYALHSVATLMGRVTYDGKVIAFSADHIYDAWRYAELKEQGVLTRERLETLSRFLFRDRPDIIIHEIGSNDNPGGPHTALRHLLALEDDIQNRIIAVHTALSHFRLIQKGYIGLTQEVSIPHFGNVEREILEDVQQKVRLGGLKIGRAHV